MIEATSNYRKRENCRICDSKRLIQFLSLGHTPLANSFLQSPDEFASEVSYPLDLYFCESCSLVQLLDVVNPEILFRNYIYLSGTSETMSAHFHQYARTLQQLLALKQQDLVIEVASNDGTLLSCFQGIRTLGIEPARNIAAVASARGIETLDEFFDSSTASRIRKTYGPAKAVIANNVLAHVDDSLDFLSGCKTLLEENGLLIIEVPWIREMINRLEYDTVYHEHLCYFSLNTLIRACKAVKLTVLRVDHLQVHGGSIRIYAASGGETSDSVGVIAEAEREAGLQNFGIYERFAQKTNANREALRDLLTTLKTEQRSVAAYGAPAKGNTLLNYCRIGTDLAKFAVDKNPWKVGKYTPGMHIPVRPVNELLENRPDYAVLLSWNLADEILKNQQPYRAQGGQFILPIPEPRIV